MIVNQNIPVQSVNLGNVPVVLRPDNVVVGGETFTPGENPVTIVQNGQTFRLDSNQLSSPQTTINLPKAGSPAVASAGLVTAGGQVFLVGLGQVQAPGLTVPFPTGAGVSSFVFQGQTFQINPSQIVLPDQKIDVPLPPGFFDAQIVLNGQTLSIDGRNFLSQFSSIAIPGALGTIVFNGQTLAIGPTDGRARVTLPPVPGITAAPTVVTLAGNTFSLGPSAAIIGGSTYSFQAGQAPTTIVDNGRQITIGPNGVQVDGTLLPAPTPPPRFSEVTAGGLTFSVGASGAVIDGHTFTIEPGSTPFTTIVNGQTISIGPQGIGLASTTVGLLPPEPTYSVVTAGGLTFSVGPSGAVIGGQTFTIKPGGSPTTTVINGQTISIGPNGIGLASTTVRLPADPSFSVVTRGSLTFSLSPSEAVISGKTYRIGAGSVPITTNINGEIVTIGPNGIGIAGTTASLPTKTPGPSATVTTVNGIAITVEPTDVIISGTTYPIGSGASPTTLVIGSATISIGPSGIGFNSTTIRPTSPPTSSATALARSATTAPTASQTGISKSSASSLVQAYSNFLFSTIIAGYVLVLLFYM